MMNVRNTAIVLIGIALVLGGCQRSPKTDGDGPTIALVLKTVNNPFFIDLEAGARQAAEELGVNLLVQVPSLEIDVEKQIQVIENLIQRKVDALCITPSGSREIVPAIVKANRAGIPVLTLDSRVDSTALVEAGAEIVTYIGSDNVKGGRIAGETIIQLLGGRGKIAILEGIPGQETGDARLYGFHLAVDSEPLIEIIASQTGNWEREQGFNVFQNILEAHPEVEAMFACNDMMALGAVQAIDVAGKTGDIIVVGFDAIEDSREEIRQGTMYGSIAQNPFMMGKLGIEQAYRYIQGEEIPKYIPVKIGMITRDNVDQSVQTNGGSTETK